MAMGIGMTLGPVMSSALYGKLGYSNTFFFYSGFISVFGIGSACFLPDRLDQKAKKKEEKRIEKESEALEKLTVAEELTVTYGIFFKNRRSFLAILVPFIACIFLLYFGPILSP